MNLTNVPTCLGVALLLVLAVGTARAELPGEDPIRESDREHWSFQPLVRPEVPEVVDTGWCTTPVDRFILHELEQRDLQPMPQADRGTLLRRVTFDLTGLPPTPKERQAFLDDDRPGAFERLVDRLLASSAYGERWGQHWLDLARFAETDGFEHDHVRPNAWRYRDWVVEAMNADMPYDEFVRLQLAGDELRPDDPAAAIATGFLLCGPDMPDINLVAERRHNFLNDMTGTVSSVLLGLTMQCASCHDHKYDPLSQADFYRLRAFFDAAEIFGEREIPTAEDLAARQQFEIDRARRWKSLDADIAALKKQDAEESRDRLLALEEEFKQLKQADPPPMTMGRVVRNPRKSPDPSRLWLRGDFRRPGPELEPAFVRIVNLSDASVGDFQHRVREGEAPAEPRGVSGQRTALAEWLVSGSHPLTARVMVNRLWQHHFGRGLTGTPSDVGIMGDWPTHPELLDWLASEFIEREWSRKAMHRLMVTSSVYQTASRDTGYEIRDAGYGVRDTSDEVPNPDEASNVSSRNPKPETRNPHPASRIAKLVAEDPRNELLGRMRRQRLDGEAIRDGMLSAAGLLNREAGGPGVRPPLPEEVTSTLLKNQWPVTKDAGDWHRRSLYLFVRRNLPYPLLSVFDRPDTNQSCPARNETTIAPQALHLLNSEFALECAQALAARLQHATPGDPPRQIELATLLTLGREPDEAERRAAREFLADGSSQDLVDYCLALFNLNEFLYVD
jgi:hypothetical protein